MFRLQKMTKPIVLFKSVKYPIFLNK